MQVVASIIIVQQRTNICQEECGYVQLLFDLDINQFHLLYHGFELLGMHDGLPQALPHLLLNHLQLLVKSKVASGDSPPHDQLPTTSLVISSMVVNGLLKQPDVLSAVLESHWQHLYNLQLFTIGLSQISYLHKQLINFFSLFVCSWHLVQVGPNDDDNGMWCSERKDVQPWLQLLQPCRPISEVEEK